MGSPQLLDADYKGSIAPRASFKFEQAHGAVQKRAHNSCLLWAASLYILINVVLSCWLSHRTPPPIVMPINPQIMFVGSSVIASPLGEIEHKTFDLSYRYSGLVHRLPCLEAELSKDYKIADLSAVQIAVVGQQLDTSAELVDTLLTGDKIPKVLVLAISPVVLVEARRWPSDLITTVKRRIFSPANADRHQLYDAVGYFCRDSFDLYQQLKVLCCRALSASYFNCGLGESRASRFLQVQRDYLNWYGDKIQKSKMASFKRLIELCDRRSIKIVVVSTPLMKMNRDLMRQFTYRQYSQAIQQAVGSATLIDLGESNYFVDDDFRDPAHLNASGGLKLMRVIMPKIVSMMKS